MAETTRWDFASRTVITRLTPDENRMITQWRLERLKATERWPRALKRLGEIESDKERQTKIYRVADELQPDREWDYKDQLYGGSSSYNAWLLRLDRVVRDRERPAP